MLVVRECNHTVERYVAALNGLSYFNCSDCWDCGADCDNSCADCGSADCSDHCSSDEY